MPVCTPTSWYIGLKVELFCVYVTLFFVFLEAVVKTVGCVCLSVCSRPVWLCVCVCTVFFDKEICHIL